MDLLKLFIASYIISFIHLTSQEANCALAVWVHTVEQIHSNKYLLIK